jgi:NAD(P)H-quinone oxidoreductase subunit 6
MNGKLGKILGWVIPAAFVIAFVGFIGSRVIGPLAAQGGEMVLGTAQLSDIVFFVIAALTVAGAAAVALSRNILYSALGLLMALLGAGSLYVFLSADFLAVAQLLVYIGGVLVLVLFAVMLTSQIREVNISNKSFGVVGGVLLFLAAAPLLLVVALRTPWAQREAPALRETTAAIGNAFLKQWLLPFELASLILVATLIGAVVIARKETSPE